MHFDLLVCCGNWAILTNLTISSGTGNYFDEKVCIDLKENGLNFGDIKTTLCRNIQN